MLFGPSRATRLGVRWLKDFGGSQTDKISGYSPGLIFAAATRSLSDSKMKSSKISDRLFYKTAAMERFISVDTGTGPNPNLKTLTKDPYLSFWLFLLVLKLFGQGEEPFEQLCWLSIDFLRFQKTILVPERTISNHAVYNG